MSSLDVERRLTEVLHRRAEDAMSQTDTQHELREFLIRGDQEPPRALRRDRFTAVVAAGAAAAASAAAVFWAVDITAPRAEPAPIVEPGPQAAEVAERFVAAYATYDTETVAAMAANPGEARAWHMSMARDAAWGVEFIFEPCQVRTSNRVGTGVLCPFSLHVMGSEEVGRGPFENATFTLWLTEDGKVFEANPTWNYETNGMTQHVEAVSNWVFEEHPDQTEVLALDEPDVPAAEWDRWLGMWQEYVADYVDAHTRD